MVFGGVCMRWRMIFEKTFLTANEGCLLVRVIARGFGRNG